MSWNKMLLVLKREYVFNFKRKSFLFTAFGIPLLTLAVMFLIIRFTVGQETNLADFSLLGVVDRAGIVSDLSTPPNEKDAPEYTLVTDPALVTPEGDDPAAREAYFAALENAARQQFDAGDLDGYLVIADDYILTGQVDLYTRNNIPEALSRNITAFMRQQLAAIVPDSVPVSPDLLANPVEEVFRDIDTGKELSESALAGRMMLPFIFVFIYFIASSTTAQFLMSGVVEEKENRMMEILATSAHPGDLLWGKMLGLAALSFTQIGLWLGAGLLIILLNEDAREFASGVHFAPLDIALFIVLFVINFLLFASVMLGIGASVTAEAESRQFAGIFSFINVAPTAMIVTFFINPNGPLPVFFSFFPFTAATGLILRFGMTSVPFWQIALSVVIQVISVLIVMWAATKVFRLGMLMYGKRLTPREFWRAVREGRVALTTAGSGAANGPAAR